MFEDIQRKTTTVVVAGLVAALGAGSVAVAATTQTAKPAANTPSATAGTTAADVPESAADKADAGTAADRPESAADKADTGTSAEQESKSEAVDSDGPGGHHDEPGNPNADTQQEGVH